jgi:hypothetical protein
VSDQIKYTSAIVKSYNFYCSFGDGKRIWIINVEQVWQNHTQQFKSDCGQIHTPLLLGQVSHLNSATLRTSCSRSINMLLTLMERSATSSLSRNTHEKIIYLPFLLFFFSSLSSLTHTFIFLYIGCLKKRFTMVFQTLLCYFSRCWTIPMGYRPALWWRKFVSLSCRLTLCWCCSKSQGGHIAVTVLKEEFICFCRTFNPGLQLETNHVSHKLNL